MPFSVGLQLLHADDASNGVIGIWTRNNRVANFDVTAKIESAFEK
jgi:hypothetical protein